MIFNIYFFLGNKVDILCNDNLLFNTTNKCTYSKNKDDNQGIANIQVKKIISSKYKNLLYIINIILLSTLL